MNFFRASFLQPRKSDSTPREHTRPESFAGPSNTPTETTAAPDTSAERAINDEAENTVPPPHGLPEEAAVEVLQASTTPRGSLSTGTQAQSTGSGRLSATDTEAELSLSRRVFEQQRKEDGGKSERLDTWRTFTKEHSNVLTTRIRADEIRRRARIKRRALLKLVRDSANSGQTIPLEQAAELEALEAQLDDMEEELVRAEVKIGGMLPKILGSEPERTFEVLEDDGIHFQVENSESTASGRIDPESDSEPSPDERNLLMKLSELDFIEEQLMELRDDKQRLRGREKEEMNLDELSFLNTYDERKFQLKAHLHKAKSELESLRNALPSRFSLEEEAAPSEPVEKLARLSDAKSQSDQVYRWMEGSLPF